MIREVCAFRIVKFESRVIKSNPASVSSFSKVRGFLVSNNTTCNNTKLKNLFNFVSKVLKRSKRMIEPFLTYIDCVSLVN